MITSLRIFRARAGWRSLVRSGLILATIALGVTILAPDGAMASVGAPTRVSTDSGGAQGNNASGSPSISSGGRYTAFASDSSNLVAGDTNGYGDIFVKDRTTGTATRVSCGSSGVQGNESSYDPSISADGRYVAFASDASNLVAGDTNGSGDVFVKDRTTGTTTRVSCDSSGVQGNEGSYAPSISSGGRYVAFASSASNLVAGDTNGDGDIFVKDLTTRTTTRVSCDSSSVQGNDFSGYPSISADGRYVAFLSDASNLVAGDTNDMPDVFVKDRTTRTTASVSSRSGCVTSDIWTDHPSISADGRYVAFFSSASNLVAGDTNGHGDIFVKDLTTGTTSRVSCDSGGVQGNHESGEPSISADGRYVAFASYASNLVAGDTNGYPDIFVKDRTTGTTTRVRCDSSGGQDGSPSGSPSISADGRYVAFQSEASDLVAGDTNGQVDVFVGDTMAMDIPIYTLTYTAGTGGIIRGTNPQSVADNSSGTAVTAVPKTGYRFIKWSDGKTANPRRDTNVTANKTVTAQFAKVIKKASIARTPNKSKVTYARKHGVAKFKLSAVIKGWGGKAVAGKYIYLQSSKNGRTWSNTYRIKTSSAGKASKTLKIKTKRVRYYRWYVPARSQVCLKTYSKRTKVTVK